MGPSEDSIRILEMRIRRQMNDSLQKNMKPENIKYYVPSTALPKPDVGQENHMGHVESTDTAIDGTKSGSTSGDGAETDGLPIAEAGTVFPAEEGGLPISEEYIDRVVGTPPMLEYEQIEIPEPKEIQHARAMSGYERSRSLDRKGFFNMEDQHFLDSKG